MLKEIFIDKTSNLIWVSYNQNTKILSISLFAKDNQNVDKIAFNIIQNKILEIRNLS